MTIRRTVAAVVAAGVLLVGCSGGGADETAGSAARATPPASTAPASPTGGAAASGKYTSALLPADALPQGMQVRRTPVSAVPLEQLKQRLQRVQIEPPECAELARAALKNVESRQGAVLVASNLGQGVVTEVVTPATVDLSSTEQLLGTCSEVTVSVGNRLTGSSTIERIDPPAVEADAVLAYRQSTTFDLPPNTPSRVAQAVEQLGNTTTVLMQDGGTLVAVSVIGDPGVTATELAPKALRQAQQALN